MSGSILILEHPSASYGPRTYVNASKGDVTIALAVDYSTAGEKLTQKASGDKYLKLPIGGGDIVLARLLWKRLHKMGEELPTINVAGNGIYTLAKHGFTQKCVNNSMFNILSLVHSHLPIGKIVSGGQTGIDIAGGWAGVKMGVDVELLLPKGLLQRGEDKIDNTHTKEEIIAQLMEVYD